MPSKRSGGCGIEADRWVSSDSVRKPCAIGTPHGDISLQASGSTWMNWWSSVTSANVLIRSWVTSNHSPVPSDPPTAAAPPPRPPRTACTRPRPCSPARPLASIGVEPRMPDASGGRDDRYRSEEDEEGVRARAGGLERCDQHLHRHWDLVEHQLDHGVRRGPAGGGPGDQRAFLRRCRRERVLLHPPCALRQSRTRGVTEQAAGAGRDRDERAVDADEQARLAGPAHALRPLGEL